MDINEMAMVAPVAVIIPCYRCAATIERAVRSVVAQSCLPSELWLVDDASDDQGKTLQALRQLEMRFRHSLSIHVLTLPVNSGPGSARNAAWEKTAQDYIAFLDADDSWHPDKIKIQYAWMIAHSTVVLSAHRALECSVDEIRAPAIQQHPCEQTAVSFGSLLLKNCFLTRTVMLRRDIPFRFLEGKRFSEDYLLWLQIVGAREQAVILERVLGYSFKPAFGSTGLTGRLWSMEQGELENYRCLQQQALIAWPTCYLLSLFSLLKYWRRLILVGWQRCCRQSFPRSTGVDDGR